MNIAPTAPREWFTPAELLALGSPALPDTIRGINLLIERQNWRGDARRCQLRIGQGGGYEYHYSLFPAEVQAAVLAAALPAVEAPASRSSAAWATFERLPEKAKAEAARRLAAVDKVEKLAKGGMTRQLAVGFVAQEIDVSIRTLWNWISAAGEVARADRLAALAPRHAGRTATAECDPRAWDALVADYLRPEQPAFETSYWRMMRAAEAHGWSPIPSSKTLQRRMDAEFPRPVRTVLREGREAAQRIFPHQRRDRSHFHALQAVNADGHKFDVFVRWEDGSISRPMMIGFQDLYSGVILSHRIDRSENKVMVRLAFADVVSTWGIPEKAWLDNGRAFASKWITGQMANRFRFKVKDEEPEGILKALGVEVHWTTPYHGQSKPIERAWKTLCEEVSKHPKFAGAYTGNKPDAKPENYGSTAIPIEVFRGVVASEIAAHNAKTGRKSATAKNRSFLATLQESLARDGTIVRRATAEQRRMLLAAAEAVTVRKPTGEIQLMGSRYWADELVDLMGERVTVRFDPQDLTLPLAVYTLDNRFVCEAPAIGDVAFDDVDAARAHARRRADYVKAQRAYADAERRMSIDELAALLPTTEAPVPESPRVVQIPKFGRGRTAAAVSMESLEGEAFAAGVKALESGVVAFRQRNTDGL